MKFHLNKQKIPEDVNEIGELVIIFVLPSHHATAPLDLPSQGQEVKGSSGKDNL